MRGATLGYAMALGAAVCSGLNASLARFLLDDGMSAWELTQMRSVVTVAVLAVVAWAWRPRPLLEMPRARFPELLGLAAGMTISQAAYFFAITRVQIAVALVLISLYPLLIFAWLHLVHRRHLGPGLWACGVAAVVGGAVAVDGFSGEGADLAGLGAALVAAAGFAVYAVSGERLGDDYGPLTLALWSFGVASAIWLLVLPPWEFPFGLLAEGGNAAAALGVTLLGTVIAFGAIIAALRLIPAARASVILISEAAWGTLFALAIHDEGLSLAQALGAGLVLVAVASLQFQAAGEDETAPRRITGAPG